MSNHENPDLLDSFETLDDTNGDQAQINIFKASIDELFSRKKLSMKTEFTKGQVIPFAMAEIYIKKYHSKALRLFTTQYMLKAISIDRKGREDYINLIRNASSSETEEDNLMSRLFGGRK